MAASLASPSEQDIQPRQSSQQQQHTSYPQPARDLAQLGSLKAGDRAASYYQSPPPPPGQIPTHLYSPQSHDPHHHHQQQPQQEQQQSQTPQQQHNTPTWVENMSSDSFHSPPDFLVDNDG
ncbi:hypothetical protein BGX24_012741 [Mortierella sp. AD032]|nr:hypothetical protein BGX24_012741 [Mortierella sp. AD032]